MEPDRNTTLLSSGRASKPAHLSRDRRDRDLPGRLSDWVGNVAPRSRVVRIVDVDRNRNRFWSMLTPEEREHVARCRSDRRRLELMGSRCAAKEIVQAYVRELWNLDLSPDEIRVAKRPSGSPFLVLPTLNSAPSSPPRLSLAHNGSYCWAALANDGFRIGVDVQEVQSRIQRLTSFFLADSEIEIVRKGEIRERRSPDALYTAAWSAKEAAFKCVGRNVSFRKFCDGTHIVRMDKTGTVLTYGSSGYFVHQILNSKNVFSVMSTPGPIDRSRRQRGKEERE